MTFSHLEPEHAVIGYSDEPVTKYVLDRIATDSRFFFLPLDALEEDKDAYVRCDGSDLHVYCRRVGSVVLRAGTPVYGRIFLRKNASNEVLPAIRSFLQEYSYWAEGAQSGALIVNRPLSGGDICSKFSHLQFLSQCGFSVPETILSPRAEILARIAHPLTKGISTTRTVAARMRGGRLFNQADDFSAPVMLQEFVRGFDVRAHFVGLSCFALKIVSMADDYRYADKQGHEVVFEPICLPLDVMDSCWKYMRAAKLEFAGFDFKVDLNNKYWALECNSMPGFSFFDRKSDGQIVRALLEYLLGGYSHVVDTGQSGGSTLDLDRFPTLNLGAGARP